MKLLRKSEVPEDFRSDGRTVRKLIELQLEKPVSSAVFYLNDVPSGKFGKHYHSISSELIWFPKGGKIEINDEVYDMQEWDGVLLEAGDTHCYDGSDCKDVIHFAIKLPADNDKMET